MGYRIERSDFCVVVDGRFILPGLWLIHATIGYRECLGVEARRRLIAEAEPMVMRGIAIEARRAWGMGAMRVRVLIDGEGLDRFFEVLKRRQPVRVPAA